MDSVVPAAIALDHLQSDRTAPRSRKPWNGYGNFRVAVHSPIGLLSQSAHTWRAPQSGHLYPELDTDLISDYMLTANVPALPAN